MKVLLILVTFSAIGIACNRSQSDDKNKGQSESFEKKKQPNILFVISDDQSYPFASAYGYKAIHTPAFDRIAYEGVLFTNAFAASPGCSPSRAALLTGRNCWQIEQAGTHASAFPLKYVTYPDILEEAGYFVGYTGKGWSPGDWEISGRERNPAGPAFDSIKNESPEYISDTDYAANFEDFLSKRDKGDPFCFWSGVREPHRAYSKGIGLKHGKKIEDVQVPSFLPDTPEVRSDILDHCFEIEWFDRHLGRMIRMLEEAGELDNTIIIVTSDNGMPFPRAKGNVYEYGTHVPLAIRWGARVQGGRTVDDLVSLIDLAPTILEAAGVNYPGGEYPMEGRSMMNILLSEKNGTIDTLRTGVYTSRERHSSSRWNNLGYPQRALRTENYLYIRNFEPDRWPAGAPQKFDQDKISELCNYFELGPMHGGYHDIDASPTLDFMIENRENEEIARFFHLAVDKRPAEELYDISKDPGCLNNMAGDPGMAATKEKLVAQFEAYLRETNDPRILGKGDIFETYKRYSGKMREFPPLQAGPL